MMDLASAYSSRIRATSVVLDCGVDEAPLCEGDLEVLGEVVRIVVPWRFMPGTCLLMTFKMSGDGSLVKAETIVADSRPCGEREGRFLTTLIVLHTDASPGKTSCESCSGTTPEPIELCALL